MTLRVRARWWLGATAAVAVTAVGVVLGLLFGGAGAEPQPPPPPPPLTAADAQRLVADLTSGDPQRVASAVAMPPGTAVPPATAEQLRTYRSIDIDVGSFAAGDNRTASVVANAVNATGAPEVWRFYLIDVGGRWMIAETVREDGQ